MTYIGYHQEMKRLESTRNQQIADSSQVSDSLDIARKDSLQSSMQDTTTPEIVRDSQPSKPVGFTESRKEEDETLNYKEVAKIYEKMKPAEAAKILNQFSLEEASGILLNMKKRQAAQIIASMDPNLAAKISKLMLKKKAN